MDRFLKYNIIHKGLVGGSMEGRVARLEDRMSKAEDKLDRQSVEQAETRVYVKEIYKKIDEMKSSLDAKTTTSEKHNDKSNDRMAKIIERLIWAIVTVVGYFVGKGLGM